MKDLFRSWAVSASRTLGSSYAFFTALVIILGWAISGPIFHYSDTWQLIINTGTTIITFLSVFLIQNSQNRESTAMQLKLDELIRSLKEANNKMIDLESMSDEELQSLHNQFQTLRKNCDLVPKEEESDKTEKSQGG